MFGDRIRELGERQEQERQQQIALAKARRLLGLLEANHFTVELTDGDNIRVHPRPDAETVALLKAAKPEILIALRGREATT